MITHAELIDTPIGINNSYCLIDQNNTKSLSDGRTRKTTYADSSVRYDVFKSDNTYEECTRQVYEYIGNTYG